MERRSVRRSGENFRTIWQKPDDPTVVQIIDQRRLPHEYVVEDLLSWRDGARAISEMQVRGAPLIGATAAWSLYLAALESRGKSDRDESIRHAASELAATRPTAVNLRWAIDRVLGVLSRTVNVDEIEAALELEARKICDEDIVPGNRVKPSIFLRTATQVHSPRLTGARLLRQSTLRGPKASMYMSGWTRRGREIRARN